VTNPYFSPFLGRRALPPAADLFIGIFEADAITVLKEIPWQASAWYQRRHSNRLQIFADANLLSGGSIRIRSDEAVSFSQSGGRKFNPRREARILVDVVPDKAEGHDAFGAIGEG
jgi:CRISPR system Cascade subunit CasD